ncbi:protein BTG3-like [Elgaria multicarinata webbii]|uniref:protein BTG3-like n=1 Tax=Elgaria multicarinata webbii TaxID=159646 RepID=UPI002FCCBF36
MKAAVEKAVRFITRLVNRHEKLNSWQVEYFGECLTAILCERYTDHWYPDKPLKGQAYRCIRINQNHPVDESLLKACQESGLDYSELALPREITIWIDPDEVCCRLRENSRHFQVKDEEPRSGKASPELVTSDYHSESPSECSSEDEGMARASTSEPERSKAKQATQYYYNTPSPLWIPHPQMVVSYIPAYQPVTFYYIPPATVPKPPVTRKPNPNLVKRLTKRASKV